MSSSHSWSQRPQRSCSSPARPGAERSQTALLAVPGHAASRTLTHRLPRPESHPVSASGTGVMLKGIGVRPHPATSRRGTRGHSPPTLGQDVPRTAMCAMLRFAHGILHGRDFLFMGAFHSSSFRCSFAYLPGCRFGALPWQGLTGGQDQGRSAPRSHATESLGLHPCPYLHPCPDSACPGHSRCAWHLSSRGMGAQVCDPAAPALPPWLASPRWLSGHECPGRESSALLVLAKTRA